MCSTMRRSRWQVLAVCLFLLSGFAFTACSSATSPTPAPRHVAAVPTAPQPGGPDCHPPSPQDISNLGLEVQGTTPGMDLWILFLGGKSLPHTGLNVKILWKLGMSFDEPVQFVALGPNGQRLHPSFLQRQFASSWHRPGAEWGTNFAFPSSGCWDMHVTGGNSVGDVYVVIPSN